MNKFYITTPIYYVNDIPHIGHAYTTLSADVIARYWRQKEYEVLFATGVDENAQKTVQAAEAAGKPIVEYTQDMADIWRTTWEKLGISNDCFIRTTSDKHKTAVYEIIKRVQAGGDIYKDSYKGFYCVGCESFIKEADLVDGLCPDHKTEPQWLEEDNFFFKLSKYQQQLLDHIESHPDFIQPISRRHEVLSFIKQGLQDFSVSRSTQQWGIPWPDEPGQVVYVWFDALTNYLTATGFPEEDFTKFWPADLHLIGKDISKFHCIYWPAMLMSAGLPLPKQIFAHGFFTIDGQKISKSLGNAVDPLTMMSKYGIDTLRYYLFSEIPFGEDGEFNHQRFQTVYTTDLADDLGNLVQRVAVLISKHLDGVIGELPGPTIKVDPYDQAIQELKLSTALKGVWQEIRNLNVYLQENKPWEKVSTDKVEFERIVRQTVANLLLIADLLKPFLPDSSQKISATFADGKIHPEVGLLFPKK
ncbi:MAG: class I tRNA ligase family protein [Candidatus Saccharimonadales bacterium]|jgi:methionyl-tRNA synthetase